MTLIRAIALGAVLVVITVAVDYLGGRGPQSGIQSLTLVMMSIGLMSYRPPNRDGTYPSTSGELAGLCGLFLLTNGIVVATVAMTFGWRGGTVEALLMGALVSVLYPSLAHRARARRATRAAV